MSSFKSSLKKILLGEQGLVVIFAVAFVIVSLTVPNFLTERNMIGLLQSVVTIGIVACTMMVCLASREVRRRSLRVVSYRADVLDCASGIAAAAERRRPHGL